MNQLQHYVTSPLVSLSRFSHPDCAPHEDPPEETDTCYTISFVERDGFSMRVGRREWRVRPGVVCVTNPGMVFSFRHSEEVPRDVTFVVSYQPEFSEGLLREADLGAPRLPPVLPLNNRLAYLHLLLGRACAGSGDVLAAETLAGELFVSATRAPSSGTPRLFKRRQLAWYVERVEAARGLLEAEYQAPHTLGSLARLTGMSPFHFARVFRELTGTPPHRYLLRVRLARASEMLRDGMRVTDACFAAGFANLSHFTRLFRRAYGEPPSRFLPNNKD